MSKFLESHALRIQESVFELLADQNELVVILKQAVVAERFDALVDSLRAYPLCVTCRGGSWTFGVGDAPVDPNQAVVL